MTGILDLPLKLHKIIFFVDIDDCVNNPCDNGVCIDGVSGFTCNCEGTGFQGYFCEIGKLQCNFVLLFMVHYCNI